MNDGNGEKTIFGVVIRLATYTDLINTIRKKNSTSLNPCTIGKRAMGSRMQCRSFLITLGVGGWINEMA